MGDNDNTVGSSAEGLPTGSVSEKGSRNKRKFISDISADAPVDVSTVSLTEFPRYEMLEEKFRTALDELGSMMEMPDGTSEQEEEEEEDGDEDDTDEYLLADWDDPIACQLEELLTNNLFTTFCTAVKKIVDCGYTEEVAEWSVLNSNMFHGSKDPVSNVVDGALALLKREKEFNTPKHSIFEGLQSLVDYTLLEMVHVLREVRPDVTIAEAMWCLLMSDLNLLNACLVDGGQFGKETPWERSTLSQLKGETLDNGQSDSDKINVLKQMMPSLENSQQKTIGIGSALQLSHSKSNPGDTAVSGNASSVVLQEAKGTFSSQGIASDEKYGVNRKGSSSMTVKRDMLRQRALHFEKNYKGRMSKGAFKAKVAALGSMMLEKSLKSQSGLSSVVTKGTYSKLTTSTGTSSSYVEGRRSPSNNPKSDAASAGALAAKDPKLALPATSPKSPLSSKTDLELSGKGKIKTSDSCKATDYYSSVLYDEALQKHVAHDDRDRAILMLVPHKQALEKELQGWTDWANEKVMQAARRLGKDQGELKMLRLEKEETEKFKKEKQTLEESTSKRLSEMEYALGNARSQIEAANTTAQRLEQENAVLKKEMEAAMLQALRSATNLDEATQREQETLKKVQPLDAEKSLLQEQLTNLKRHATELEIQLEKTRERKLQKQDLWLQEVNEMLKLSKVMKSLREKKDEGERLTKVEEDKIKQLAQKNREKCEEDIKSLESMISELRLESDKMQIAALSVGYGSCLAGENISTNPALRGHTKPNKRLAMFEEQDVKPERECVMCMTDEISVVFLPCSHQVLCKQCSVLHERQGMNDCPSCRTTIEKRVSVTYRGGGGNGD
ncbi:putative E3 ubiquitin-protein ligase RF298 [Andrographis paniculata]|uniref:putative E3 ubiquitin-protein ligase RF298 n=1 Tax=Andrographis paniculata TaxID=175694 RepID=UPI0021E9AB19|nr:putative E3 ubiquitin-protein ligase RF298 [Andrographis paniculata]XP_051131053.1 putative E3 ubiquitin-protein ligase RF298 [Andrographis paniculata]XP_051131054.1 putative E3 ubiquitin-protein ligase RF298 [Andrographis paniculata]XP_051131055.1 putative E3 ubiquitin-protein ligase RF298 [Andrographis paniculata]